MLIAASPFPRLTAEEADFARRRRRSFGWLRLPGEPEWRCRPAPAADFDDPVAFGLECLAERLKVTFSLRRLAACQGLLWPLSVTPVDPEAVAEELLLRGLAALASDAERESFRYLGLTQAPPPHPFAQPFEVAIGAAGFIVLITPEGNWPGLLDRWLENAPRARNGVSAAIRVEARIEWGRYSTTVAGLRGLEVDDAILAPAAASGGKAWLVIEEGFCAPLQALDGGYRVTGPASKLTRSEMEPLAPEKVPQPQGHGKLDDLPLTLVFEAGRLQMPLGVLETLAPGYVLTPPARKPGVIDIMLNGRRLGAAEIVDVEGSQALRVVEWLEPGARA